MTPDIFIKSSIDSLTNKFKKIACKYEFHSLSDSYYLEVLPKMAFDSQKSLQNDLISILKEFNSLFPDDLLVFFTAGEGIIIEKPEYEKLGSDFNNWLKVGELRKTLDNSSQIKSNEVSVLVETQYLAA